LLLASAYYRSELIVDRLLASLAPSGGLSLFVLARQLYEAGGAILYRAVASPAAVVLSRQAAREEWGLYADNARKQLWTVACMGASAVVAILVLGKPVLAAVFEHRRFSASDTELLWGLLMIMGPMFVCNVVGDFLNSASYAFGNTATPARIMAAVYTMFIGVKLLAFSVLQIYGLAIAASCHGLVLAVALGFGLHRSLRARRSNPSGGF
jgi:putative peptidoglycan lipid II flippase